MSQATYEWIRIDSDLDWICTVKFQQPDFMWISQLQRDRDVIAQLEVSALESFCFLHGSRQLTHVLARSGYPRFIRFTFTNRFE